MSPAAQKYRQGFLKPTLVAINDHVNSVPGGGGGIEAGEGKCACVSHGQIAIEPTKPGSEAEAVVVLTTRGQWPGPRRAESLPLQPRSGTPSQEEGGQYRGMSRWQQHPRHPQD